MKKLTFAIMGATGHIGHYLTEELLKKGHKVRALGRDVLKLKTLKAKGAQVYSGDFTDSNLLAEIFTGCDGVFALLPPAYNESDMIVFREKTGEAIAQAIAKAGVTYVVNLSSIGAGLPSGTGPIKALHHLEERLNSIQGLNVLHFRAGFFMENFISMIKSIKSSGKLVGTFNPNLAIPMVATQDIAHKIAEYLDTLKFKGSSVFEFSGPQDVTMTQAATILGKAMGNAHLKYAQIPYQQMEKSMISSGMKHHLAHLLIEMYRAFDEGKITSTQKLAGEHRGKTTFEQFSKTLLKSSQSMGRAA
jgi:uncharacterized protein YbjT (DUF2867 family)